MKAILISIVITAVTFIGCADNKDASKDAVSNIDTSQTGHHHEGEQVNSPSSAEVVGHYLHLKNALTNDNGTEAAEAANQLHKALLKLDTGSFTANQKKIYEDLKDDLKEHAEHISANAEKIAHQREHFDMLSKDMYDLVKSIKPNQTLYKDHCPMFNDNKGAIWLSEVKDIKNPYFGKKMLTCGKQEEEIK